MSILDLAIQATVPLAKKGYDALTSSDADKEKELAEQNAADEQQSVEKQKATASQSSVYNDPDSATPDGKKRCEANRTAYLKKTGQPSAIQCGAPDATASKVGEPVFKTSGATAGSTGEPKKYKVTK